MAHGVGKSKRKAAMSKMTHGARQQRNGENVAIKQSSA